MTQSYLRLGLPPTARACAVVRAAVRGLHLDTLAMRSVREARKRYDRELLKAHAKAQAQSRASIAEA